MHEDYNDLSLGAFAPNRLHLKINALKSAVGADKYNAIEFHEIWHYFQTCMTAFGQKSWNSYRQGVGFIFDEWVRMIDEMQIKPKIPLGYFSQNNKKAATYSYLLINSYFGSTGIALARSYVDPKYKYLKDLSIMLYPHEWLINPEVIIEDKKYNIQGRDVIEGHAIYIEAAYSFNINKVPMHETLDRKKVPRKYFICLDYFIKSLGPTRIPEFPIICDIALQAYWNEPVETEDQWRASHPGWRFVRIIEVLRDENVQVKTIDIINNYEYYCETILRACGYQSLQSSLAAAAGFYTERHLLKTEERMLEALKFRQENLCCGGDPFNNRTVWIEMKKLAKPSFVQSGDGLGVIVDPAEKDISETTNIMDGFMLETIGEIHLQAIVAQLLGSKHHDCGSDQFCCGYKYFNTDNGCFFQSNGLCTGILSSGQNAPVDTSVDANDVSTGCSFEIVFKVFGINISDITVDFTQNISCIDVIR